MKRRHKVNPAHHTWYVFYRDEAGACLGEDRITADFDDALEIAMNRGAVKFGQAFNSAEIESPGGSGRASVENREWAMNPGRDETTIVEHWEHKAGAIAKELSRAKRRCENLRDDMNFVGSERNSDRVRRAIINIDSAIENLEFAKVRSGVSAYAKINPSRRVRRNPSDEDARAQELITRSKEG